MTTATIRTASSSASPYTQTAVDRLVARFAVSLLRWTNRRALSASMSHDEMSRLRATAAAVESRPVYSALIP